MCNLYTKVSVLSTLSTKCKIYKLNEMEDNMHVSIEIKSEDQKFMTNIKAPLVAVDTVVLGILDGRLSVLLIQIGEGPYLNKWAVPGGLVKMEESLDEAAVRVLTEKTSLKNIYLEQLYTFGDPKRDMRDRSVSVAYFALVGHPEKLDIESQGYYKSIKWFHISELPEMAFDHNEVVKVAHERLKGKLTYTNIAYSLVPEEFALTDLQRVYEMIMEEPMDKRNFRKRLKNLDLVEPTGKMQTDVTHRPAELYRFKDRELQSF